MKGHATRGAARERVLLLARLTIEDGSEDQRIRVLDLSEHGLRGEGDVLLHPGEHVEVDFGSAGKVKGVVAWCDSPTFGISLKRDIEPGAVRNTVIHKDTDTYEPPRFVRGLAQAEEPLGPPRKV